MFFVIFRQLVVVAASCQCEQIVAQHIQRLFFSSANGAGCEHRRELRSFLSPPH